MESNCFIFDVNKCVGCNACVAGCIIENSTEHGLNWRTVSGFNPSKHPDLPLFYFSLACNHCQQAPCMANCPALAYTRDAETGAIVHHTDRCMGCQYCTWACPYDAPKFNKQSRVIEKCNFCFDRIKLGKNIACSTACPVGALSFGRGIPNADIKKIPGFINRGINPSISIIPLKEEDRKPLILNNEGINHEIKSTFRLQTPIISKIRVEHEWPLVFFTLIAAILSAWFASHFFSESTISFPWFFLSALVGMFLSSIHLGVKTRAWRSILNIKGSWLSREILGFTCFTGFALFYFLSDRLIFGIAGIVSSVVCIVSADMLYKFTIRKDGLFLHSAQIWLSTALFWSLFSGYTMLIITFLVVKFLFYSYRKYLLLRYMSKFFLILSLFRISVLLVAIYLFLTGSEWDKSLTFILISAGEFIDRIEFYSESEIETPENKLNSLLFGYLK